MPAKKDEGGNVPTHNKNTNRHTHDRKADGRYISQVLRRQEQSIGSKTFHKSTIHHAEHDEPKDQQHLVFAKMQEDELNGQGIKYTSQISS